MKCSPEHSERTKRGDCAECARLRAREWVANNPNMAKATKEKWRVENRDRDLANKREWYRKNKPKMAAIQKEKYDPVRQRRLFEKWYPQNREAVIARAAAWKKANPDARRVSDHNRRARKRSSAGRHTKGDILEILKMQKGRCGYCREKLGAKRHIDHIIPLSGGGHNGRRNLQILCARCNIRKSALDPIDFAQRLGRLL
jgi:5-methylcytosine-specific restriction endonuclease McrA